MGHGDLLSGVFQQKVKQWITASFSFTIAYVRPSVHALIFGNLISGDYRNNVYCTVAIILRVWRTHHVVAQHSFDSYLWRVLRVFTESAALLT